MYLRLTALLTVLVFYNCSTNQNKTNSDPVEFIASLEDETIQIFTPNSETPIITQHMRSDHRPYIHPILAPNSDVELTQYSPSHHKHQTGLYWGFTRVNGTGATDDTLKEWFYKPEKPNNIKQEIGRDFFHNPEGSHWKKINATLLVEEGQDIKWQTEYHMLNQEGKAILEETQLWTFKQSYDKYLLELEWKGKAMEDITINEFDYGGLFLRMPWKKDMVGEAVNAARQKNNAADGKRAMWVDVGLGLDGMEENGHIAIFDHPDNAGFPQPWRVDGQLGIGPVRAKLGDWHIKKGSTETIRHQVVAYSGKLSDIELNKLWADYVNDDGMYNQASLWGIAQEEGRNAEFLTADEAVTAMTIKSGFEVNAFATEPMITQPMAFCWDDKGRLWIAENRDYESRQEGFANDGTSRILILEDTDGDGKADSKKVFLEGVPFPAAIAVGFDGLYVGAPPNLLFVPDKNQNDRAEAEEIEVLLTGWGIRDRHETINSFHWGPDGWLYGLEGFATPSKIRKPQGKGKLFKKGEAFPEDLLEAEGVDINGGVWRFHPVKKTFEVVAHGFSNPWGIDYDSKGQLFISACVIPHLFHIIPGGIYHRQGGKHFNPYVYEDIQTIVDHRHRSAHGGARVYLSDAFPNSEYGRIFMANIHEHAVLSDILKPNGSGFSASHGDDFMLANNAAWIGFSMELGPDGGLYVLDWHDGDICGNDVMHKETGRVFRIMPEKSNAVDFENRYADLKTLDDLALVNLQFNKSSWHARRARVILQHRATERKLSEPSVDRIEELLLSNNDGDIRLRALWTKHLAQLTTEENLLPLLNDGDEYMRAWAIQLLTETEPISSHTISSLEELASSEDSPVVRLYLSAALQRLDQNDRWNIVSSLIQNKEDQNDPNIPYMLWFGMESLINDDLEKFTAMAQTSQIPFITSKIARRTIDANQVDAIVQTLQNKSSRVDILNGILAGLQGRTDLDAPEQWDVIYDQLKSDNQSAEIALQVAQQFGSAEASRELMVRLKDNDKTDQEKRAAINALALQQSPELLSMIPTLLTNTGLRSDAIRAVAAFNDEQLGKLLLDQYPSYSLAEKQEVIQTMASRSLYGWQLAIQIKEGVMPRRDIPAYVALQLKRVVGHGFVEIWGPIDEVSSDKAADYAKYQRMISEDAIVSADPSNGRLVYNRTCWSCHKMYGEGGIIGPDLTGSNRANLSYLLSNIIDPSGEIQDDYKMVVITMQDGRTYSGNIVAENDRQLTMNIVGQDELIVEKSMIQTREDTPNSMMPEGLLNQLSEEEVIDLVAYMRTLEQVDLLEL